MNKVKDFGIALIRTSIVPPTVGLVLTWLAKNNITISSTYVSSVLTVTFSGVWYIIFHGIEVLSSKPKVRKWAGIFLGFPKTPQYSPPVGLEGARGAIGSNLR
jgi:hypothetical protein